MSFNRKPEALAAQEASLLVEAVAAVLFFSNAFVWLAILGTTP